MQYGFYFDGKRCTGCKTCMLACKDYHDLANNLAFRQVYEYGGGQWRRDEAGALQQDCFAYYVSMSCGHCTRPSCMKACPTGAMHKDDQGLVSVNTRRCIGCGYCALACPYRAPRVDREAGHSVKCDGCMARLAEGLRPICVEACPLRALDFGEIGELRRRHGTLGDVPPLPPASATGPNLVVNSPCCFEEDPDRVRAEGTVQNIREIV